MRDRRYNLAWFLLPLVMGVLYFVHTRDSMVLAGLVAIAAGTVVAFNYRGAAERVPPVLGITAFRFDGSVASTRKSFAAGAVAGVVLILYALQLPA
jgi:hypothetical protein